MLDDLSQLRGQAQTSVHLVVKERSNARCSQPKCRGSNVHSVTNSTRLEMQVSILLKAEGVDVTTIRADVYPPIHYDRRRRYRVAYVIAPQLAASARVQRVELLVP
jgi:hypothetical protein